MKREINKGHGKFPGIVVESAFFLHKDYKRIPPDDNRRSFAIFEFPSPPASRFPASLVLPFHSTRMDHGRSWIPQDRYAWRGRESQPPPLIHPRGGIQGRGYVCKIASLWKIRVIRRGIIVRNGGVFTEID